MNEVSGKAARRSRAEWEELMSAYETSDLPQREFCRVNGVSYSTFGYWRKRLRTAAVDAVDATASLLDVTSLVSGAEEVPWRVELDLGGGLVLRLR